MNKKLKDILFQNKVVILFVFLCVGATIASKQPLTFVIPELFTRIARNSFIVLSLIIPVIAGMGLNFGIVIGAMAAQIALFLTTYWGLTGIGGFLATAALATPISVLFGYLVGKLFNHMKGSEMIGGLVLGYFAEGIYQFIFLFVFGGIIPMVNTKLMIPTGVGVKNTIDLKDTVKYALDNVPMLTILEVGFYLFLIGTVCSLAFKLAKKQEINWKKTGSTVAAAVVIYGISFIGPVERFLSADRLLLLSAVEICCLLTVIVQVVHLIKAKMAAKSEDCSRSSSIWPDLCSGPVQGADYGKASGYDLSVYRSSLRIQQCSSENPSGSGYENSRSEPCRGKCFRYQCRQNPYHCHDFLNGTGKLGTADFPAECGNPVYLRRSYPGRTVCDCSSAGRRRFCTEGYQQAGSAGYCPVPHTVYCIPAGR